MITAQVSTAELAGGDGQSEDRVFAATNSVVVLDGVSPLESDGDRSGWHPDARASRVCCKPSTRPGQARPVTRTAAAGTQGPLLRPGSVGGRWRRLAP